MTNTTGNTNDYTEAEIAAYAGRLYRRAESIARRGRRVDDAYDVAQGIVEQFLRQAPKVMQAYPSPEVYASVRTGHAGVSFDRSERVQRCEGALMKQSADGSYRKGRVSVSGHKPIGEDGDIELFDTIACAALPFDELVVEAEEHDAVLHRCLAGLSDEERDLLMRVDGRGEQITMIAAELGKRRETVNRQLSKIRAAVRAAAAEFAIAA